mgnify:CR=1 FL=1
MKEYRKRRYIDHLRVRDGAKTREGFEKTIGGLLALVQRYSEIEPSTGLLNKEAGMWNAIERMASESRRNGDGMAFIFFDMIKFKTINDALGQVNGDKIIVANNTILRSQFRQHDALVRYGGDETLAIVHAKAKVDIQQAVFNSRADEDGVLMPSILDATNWEISERMRLNHTDFYKQHGAHCGTFRAGLFFLGNADIQRFTGSGLRSHIEENLGALSVKVKGK